MCVVSILLTRLGLGRRRSKHTELLLDDLEDLLLIEFLGKALDSSQRLTTIALCISSASVCLSVIGGRRPQIGAEQLVSRWKLGIDLR